MPWDEVNRMDQRLRFVRDFATCRYSLTELCARYGISRPTGYKWVERWAREGPQGLVDRSRAPHSCPHQTPAELVEGLLEMRRAHPRWGPRKLLWVLGKRHPEIAWPAPSTVGDILRRHGLVEPRRRRRRRLGGGRPELAIQQPNELWSADFKGQFRLGNGRCCYPLTVVDRASRYLLRCQGLESTAHDGVRRDFERTFREYGLPSRLLTDWGVPFAAAHARAGLSRLAVWWIKLGIEVLRIEPGHPEQNGAHERLHRTLKAETAHPPAASLTAQQRAFHGFCQEYNHQRPHEALGMKTPGELYEPSPRPFPKRVPEVEYPGHFEVRRVRSKGEIKWSGDPIFVSEVLAGEWVGLEELDDGVWSLYFGPMLLGRFDDQDKKLDR